MGEKKADDLADRIMTYIADFVAHFPAVYSEVSGGHFYLHAQAGLSTDVGVTSGVRNLPYAARIMGRSSSAE